MRFALILTLCLVGVASAGSLNKRFIGQDLFATQAAELKANLDKLREALLNRFQNNADVSSEVTVEKRDLREAFDKFNKFAQTKTQEAFNNIRKAIDSLFKNNPFFNINDDETTEHPMVKRNIFQQLERMNSKAQASAQKTFESLQRAISSVFMPFKPKPVKAAEDSTEKSVAKRDIFDHFSRINEKIQNKAQEAFKELRRVFEELFNKHPEAHEIEVEVVDGEVTTERIIKRDIFDFFGRLNEKAQDQAKKIFDKLENSFDNIFSHEDDDEEDFDFDDDETTEISIEKRDVFDFFGKINEKIQDQAAKFFNRKPGPKPSPKPVPEPEKEVEEIEVVTAA